MSMFDPATLLDTTTSDALTRRPPLHAGTEMVGTIGEPKARQAPGKKNPQEVYTFLDIPVEFDLTQYPHVQKLVNLEKLTLVYGFIIELNDAGAIDGAPGKNGRLRLLREALGLNEPGKPFNLRMLQGRQIRAIIGQREADGEIFDQIDKVAKV